MSSCLPLRAIDPDRHAELLPLYVAAGAHSPLLLAVLEGRQRGQVFVADERAPQSALVLNGVGFMGLLETQPDAVFDAGLAALLRAAPPGLPSYLLWYEPPLRWQARLDAAGVEGVRRRERIRFDFVAGRADAAMPCPPGLSLHALDRTLLARAAALGLNLESRFWASADDLLDQGLGLGVLNEAGDVLSLCYSACVGGTLAEIDIITREDQRGRGLGQLAAQGFVAACLTRGLTPAWDCFALNEPSARLARRLGFVPRRRYPFYTFNTPCSWAD